MSRDISPQQQQELKQLQIMSQNLQVLQQNRIQIESTLADTSKAIEAIKDLADDAEVYRLSGQLFYKSEVPKTREKLIEEKELLEVRVNSMKKQFEDLEKRAMDLEAKLKSELGY